MPGGRKLGSPKTGGRKPGTPNRKTREIGELLESLGHNPIEAMVPIATDPNASLELRGRMNAELAQYVYPKREAVSENEGTLHAVHPRGNVLNPDRESRRGRSRFRDEA